MTLLEAITLIDSIKPNTYGQIEKIRWISNLEWIVKRDIIDKHEGADKINFNGYTEDTPTDTVLIVPSPYDEMYLRWLEAQMDYTNGEYNKYNASMSMFNSWMSSFSSYYNRNNMPLQKNGIKYF